MGHDGNVIGELTADHRAVERLFDEYRTYGPGDPKRKEIADAFTIELVRHTVAEELHLYPLLREHVDGGDDLADEEILDHAKVEQMLKRLEGLNVPNTEFNRIFDELVVLVRTHVEEEEQVVFPTLARVCTPQQLQELGDEVRRTKERAPTRPHPAAPHTPPANRMVAAGVGMVDRVRDFVTGRGR